MPYNEQEERELLLSIRQIVTTVVNQAQFPGGCCKEMLAGIKNLRNTQDIILAGQANLKAQLDNIETIVTAIKVVTDQLNPPPAPDLKPTKLEVQFKQSKEKQP